MLKRRNFPFSRKFGDDSSSDDDFPVETPPNDTKLRLLRSNFNHDNHFFFKIAASKYYSSSPKNENERSLQLDHEIYRPDISPELFRANRAIAEQEQNASRTNRLDTSCSIKNTANSLSPSRRKARILNPTALPTPSIKAKPANPQKLRDIVRRKSCHCRECGPLSRLEKKTMHLPPEPRKPRIRISPPKVSTPRLAARSPQNSKTPSSDKGRLRRGSVASSIFSKKPENDDFVLPQLSDIKTRSRNKTYDGPQSLVVPVIDNIEKIEEEVAKKPGKLERSDTRKISGKRSEKKSEKSMDKSPMKDKLLKNISIREVYAAKIVTAVKIVSTVHNKLKKVRAKRYSSVKGDTTTVSGDQSARTYDSEAKPYASITKENSRKNFSSEKGNSETARTSLSMISKEMPSLKSLTAADNKKSKPPLGAMQVEKVSKVSTLGFSLNKMKLRPNAASFSENRALSLPRLRTDSLSALTRKDQNTSQDSDIQKMTEREENNVNREDVKKIQIRRRGSQTHRGDSQTSRELRTSTTKDLMNESLLKNMRSIVESDKIVEKNRKKKKTARGPDVVWKNYMQSAFLAYKETAGKSKTSLGSQSYRITQD